MVANREGGFQTGTLYLEFEGRLAALGGIQPLRAVIGTGKWGNSVEKGMRSTGRVQQRKGLFDYLTRTANKKSSNDSKQPREIERFIDAGGFWEKRGRTQKSEEKGVR